MKAQKAQAVVVSIHHHITKAQALVAQEAEHAHQVVEEEVEEDRAEVIG
jgi:hypothetical protein